MIDSPRKARAAAHIADLYSLPDDLLSYLRTSGREIPLRALQRRFKVGSEMLDAALEAISSWGYKLKRHGESVQFQSAPDILSAVEIQFRLKSKFTGCQVHSYRSLKSTNDLAADLAEHGAPEGTVVTSEEQTKGKGRLGRSWHSPSRAGIYLSLILRPPIPPDRAPGLSILTALALAETVIESYGLEAQIKWPNDILVGGRKLAGILTELNADRNQINYVIVGVGVNVNQRREEFPPELHDTATSLRIAGRHTVNRAELVREFLHRFERHYLKYLKQGLKPFHAVLVRRSSLLGKQVTLATGQEQLVGLAVDITSLGALVLETESGRKIISAGEVSVAKK